MDSIVGNIEKVETLTGTIKYPGVGDSAYEVAVNNGFVGTEKDWLASLKGEKGDRGEQGIQGIQGIRGERGIQGEKGDKGETGEKGDKGDKGDTGDVSKEQLNELEDKLLSQIPKGKATGESITLNDSSNLQYIKFNMNGKSIQEGTPTPEAPVEIQSVGDDVNILPNLNTTRTINGVTFTKNDDGSTTIDGTATADTNYIVTNANNTTARDQNIEIGDYVLSGINGGSSSTYFAQMVVNDGTNTSYITLNSGEKTFKINSNSTYYFYIAVKSGTTINTTIYPKLQKGTVATAYSEYGKGTVEIKQNGKNLFDDNYNNYTKPTDYWICPIKLEQGKTYVLNSVLPDVPMSSVAVGIAKDGTKYSEFSSAGVFFAVSGNGSIANAHKFTVDDSYTNPKLIIYSIIQEEIPNIINHYKVQLEEDTETIEYEPYKCNNYVIPTIPLRSLPNGVKDTIEEDGIHRRVRSVILDGSDDENWAISGLTFYSDYIKDYKKGDIIPISNYFVGVNSKNGAGKMLIDNTIAFGNQDVPADRIYIKYDSITTVEEFKAWLQENPIQVDYELAEEVIEPFDEEQYNNLINTGSFKGVTNISSSRTAPEFDIEYYKDLETLLNRL